MDEKFVFEEVGKRRSAIVKGMNEFGEARTVKLERPAEYVLWLTSLCQLIAYVIDKEFDHDEDMLDFSLDTIKDYFQLSKKNKEEIRRNGQ